MEKCPVKFFEKFNAVKLSIQQQKTVRGGDGEILNDFTELIGMEEIIDV